MSALNPTPTPPPKEHVPRVDFGRSWHKFSKRKPTSLTELFLKSKERKGNFTHECRLSCGTRVTERLERLCCCSVWLLLFARPGQVKSIRIILPYHFPFWGIKLPRLSFVPLPRASESELCPRRCAIAYKRNPANSICPTPTWILSVLPFSLNCAICLPGSLLPLAFFLVRFFFSHIFFFVKGAELWVWCQICIVTATGPIIKENCGPVFLVEFGDAACWVSDSGAEVWPQAFHTINIHLCNLSLPNDAVHRPPPWDRVDVNREETTS